MARRRSTTSWTGRMAAYEPEECGPKPHFENCRCSDCAKSGTLPKPQPKQPGDKLTVAEAYRKDAAEYRYRGYAELYQQLIVGMLKGTVKATVNADGTTEYSLTAKGEKLAEKMRAANA